MIDTFKRPKFFWFRYKLAELRMGVKRLRYPENVWYGGGIKQENALRSVGQGWAKFINNLYAAKPKHVKVWQVKEKWGGLRFYINSGPEWYHDLISYYEHESDKTCETCGKEGKARTDLGWVLTLCDEHYKEDKTAQLNGSKR